MSEKVKINIEVYEGLEAVRKSGLTNMFNRVAVIDLAYQMGYEDAAEWIGLHPGDYSHGIFVGFEVKEDD